MGHRVHGKSISYCLLTNHDLLWVLIPLVRRVLAGCVVIFSSVFRQGVAPMTDFHGRLAVQVTHTADDQHQQIASFSVLDVIFTKRILLLDCNIASGPGMCIVTGSHLVNGVAHAHLRIFSDVTRQGS